MELKLWHITQVSIVNKCTKFERNRPTPISKPAPVSQAEALKMELLRTNFKIFWTNFFKLQQILLQFGEIKGFYL